jgi:hypothetical protein
MRLTHGVLGGRLLRSGNSVFKISPSHPELPFPMLWIKHLESTATFPTQHHLSARVRPAKRRRSHDCVHGLHTPPSHLPHSQAISTPALR